MKIGIIFATYSGSTRIAAQIIAEVLKEVGDVSLIELESEEDIPDLAPFDVIIAGSPSWLDEEKVQGRPHKWMIATMKKYEHEGCLTGKQFTVFAMGDWYYALFAKAADYLTDWLTHAGATELYPALRISKMQFHLEENSAKVRSWAETVKNKLLAK